MRAGVAGIPGAWSSEKMAASLRGEGVDAFVFAPADVTHDVTRGCVEYRGEDLSRLDAIVVKKLGDQAHAASRLRLHALRHLETRGVRVFSPPDAIDIAMDRYRMTQELARAGLPIPATLAVDGAAIGKAVERLGESVVKPVYTSKARGMERVTPATWGSFSFDASAPYLVQQFVRAPGRDIGATIVGGEFIGAFYRVAGEGEWATTTGQGGTYAPCELSEQGIDLAQRAAALFSLDYTVVDLVEHEGGFLIYEVSAFGGFKGLLEATGVDPSQAYARHVRRTIER